MASEKLPGSTSSPKKDEPEQKYIDTATGETSTHYLRPEVMSIIQRLSTDGNNASRAGNGDFWAWYQKDVSGKRLYNLANKADYAHLVGRYRTLYWSLNYFSPDVYNQVARNDDDVLGTRVDTMGYTLGIDIDHCEGTDIHDSAVKQAVEECAKFFVKELTLYLPKSVHACQSGGGIYIYLHHKIWENTFQVNQEAGHEKDLAVFVVLETYQSWLADKSDEFFKLHPEYVGKCKVDRLNYAKRIFKSLLSVHRKLPYAVIPLDIDNIVIDFEAAKLPLKPDVLAAAEKWYTSYDEKNTFSPQLEPYVDDAISKFSRKNGDVKVDVSPEALKDIEKFPPCLKNILKSTNMPIGKTRIIALLATFLGQAGWDEAEARGLFTKVAGQLNAQTTNIFESWFCRMRCPRCSTINKPGNGFPGMNMGDIGICEPDDRCKKIGSPIYYIMPEQPKSAPTGTLDVLDAAQALYGVCDGAVKKDGEGFNKFDSAYVTNILDKKEPTPKQLMKLYIMLKKYQKQLTKLGFPYEQIIVPEVADAMKYFEGERFVPKFLADEILDTHHILTMEDNRNMYIYVDGVYRPHAENEIERIAQSQLDTYATSRRIAEVVHYIMIATFTPREKINATEGYINFSNGLYNIKTRKLEPHNPELLTTIQFPVRYDPAARCPRISTFLCEVLRPEDIALILQFIGYMLTIDYTIQKVFMLTGDGMNGKGTLFRLIDRILGDQVSHENLQQLCTEKFSTANLFGKVANIFSDLPTKPIEDDAIFKGLSGNDKMHAERKFEHSFDFRSFAKMLFGANNLPKLPNAGFSVFRRWILIYFLNKFVGKNENKDLDSQLQTEEEISGLVNLMIEALHWLLETKTYYYSKNIEEVGEEYLRKSNSVESFAKECIVPTSAGMSKLAVFHEYERWAQRHGIKKVLAYNKFCGEMKKLGYTCTRTIAIDEKGKQFREWEFDEMVIMVDGSNLADWSEYPDRTLTQERNKKFGLNPDAEPFWFDLAKQASQGCQGSFLLKPEFVKIILKDCKRGFCSVNIKESNKTMGKNLDNPVNLDIQNLNPSNDSGKDMSGLGHGSTVDTGKVEQAVRDVTTRNSDPIQENIRTTSNALSI